MILHRRSVVSSDLSVTAHLLHAALVGPREMTDEEAEGAFAGCLVLAEMVDVVRAWAKAHTKA